MCELYSSQRLHAMYVSAIWRIIPYANLQPHYEHTFLIPGRHWSIRYHSLRKGEWAVLCKSTSPSHGVIFSFALNV